MKTGIHKARLGNSERLQRVMRVLADGRDHSTWEIQQSARVCAVGTCASELRHNGIAVNCRRIGDLFIYRLGYPVEGRGDII